MKKILVVDDQPAITSALNDLLSNSNFVVEIASNGQMAIDLAKEKKPDLILMDIMMPIKTGIEATRELRAEKDFKEIPIIFITARGQAGDEKTAREAGGSGFIYKPFSPKKILQTVQEILG